MRVERKYISDYRTIVLLPPPPTTTTSFSSIPPPHHHHLSLLPIVQKQFVVNPFPPPPLPLNPSPSLALYSYFTCSRTGESEGGGSRVKKGFGEEEGVVEGEREGSGKNAPCEKEGKGRGSIGLSCTE